MHVIGSNNLERSLTSLRFNFEGSFDTIRISRFYFINIVFEARRTEGKAKTKARKNMGKEKERRPLSFLVAFLKSRRYPTMVVRSPLSPSPLVTPPIVTIS